MTASETAPIGLEGLEPGLEEIEVRLLLEGIRLRYGYDFREYAARPLRRSVYDAMASEGISTISTYQGRILRDETSMHRFLSIVGVSVTSMFREADLMRCLREEVVPVLRTYPSVRIWMVGCATGEEVYSLAIMLQEEGLLRRASIYATDLNEGALAVARGGAYPLDAVRTYEDRYEAAGGRGKLSDHYDISGRTARFHRSLQANVTWARHNLVSDTSFNDFHLIVCANVLIYFRPSLQERAHRLFVDSLVRLGFLALGKAESLVFSPESSRYTKVRDGVSLFRRVR
ncbi:MAG TPA: CheR family methyltransferase [Candidatus Dormibacteraeota bacterium]|nr:CheR family methyltransferase [Candidatus Dormibacteraeota bacterium]